MNKIRKLVYTSAIIALTTLTSSVIYVPIGFAKIFPMQSVANILSAVLLGPWYALGEAFLVSLFRNFNGTGSLFAFPGSMVGAWGASILYRKSKTVYGALTGELFGTGIIGSLLTYPISILFLHQKVAAYAMMPAFLMSSFIGAILSLFILRLFKIVIGGEKYENSTNNRRF